MESGRKLGSRRHQNTLRDSLPTTFNNKWFVGRGSTRRVLSVRGRSGFVGRVRGRDTLRLLKVMPSPVTSSSESMATTTAGGLGESWAWGATTKGLASVGVAIEGPTSVGAP